MMNKFGRPPGRPGMGVPPGLAGAVNPAAMPMHEGPMGPSMPGGLPPQAGGGGLGAILAALAQGARPTSQTQPLMQGPGAMQAGMTSSRADMLSPMAMAMMKGLGGRGLGGLGGGMMR